MNTLTKKLTLSVVPLILSALPYSSYAVITRHDVDVTEYKLNNSDYQSAIHSENSSAVLIAEQWVLTAAHSFDENEGHSREQYGQLTIMGQQYDIDTVYLHPDYLLEGDTIKNDLALLKLVESVHIITPTPPYENSDEVGKVMKLAGYGHIGNGVDGVTDECFPCELHGVDNYIFNANDDLLGIKFDNPNTGESLPLEGVSAPGDSGGPLFIDTENGRFVAGISSHGGTFYGELEGFTRVSTHLDWIKEIMGAAYPGNYDGPLYSEANPDAIPEENDEANTEPTTETSSDNVTVTPQEAKKEKKKSSGLSFNWLFIFGLFSLLLFRAKKRLTTCN